MLRTSLLFICFFPLWLHAQSDLIPFSQVKAASYRGVKPVSSSGFPPDIDYQLSFLFRKNGIALNGTVAGHLRQNDSLLFSCKKGLVMRSQKWMNGQLYYSFYRLNRDSVIAIDTIFNDGKIWGTTIIYRSGNLILKTSRSYDIKGFVDGETHYEYHEVSKRQKIYNYPGFRPGHRRKIFRHHPFFKKMGLVIKRKKTVVHSGEWTMEPVKNGPHYVFENGCLVEVAFFRDEMLAGHFVSYYGDTLLRSSAADFTPFAFYFDLDAGRKKMTEGAYSCSSGEEKNQTWCDQKSGHWTYRDSSNFLYKEEWYAINRRGYFERNLAINYYHSGAISGMETRTEKTDTTENDSIDYDEYVKREWYENGSPLSLHKDGLGYNNKDTVNAYWYKSGQIMMLEIGNSERDSSYHNEWYSNGQLKCVSNGQQPRNGVYREWDASGKLKIHRTYKEGVMVTAYDSSYNRPDTLRQQLAKKCYALAARSTFPGDKLSSGNGGSSFFELSEPSWKDELYIPEKVLDSIAYVFAGALMQLPDTFVNREPMADASFHPAPGEWVYNFQISFVDSSSWMLNCASGKIITGDRKNDSLFRMMDYSIVSFLAAKTRRGMPPSFTGLVTIKTKRPLNLVRLNEWFRMQRPLVLVRIGYPDRRDNNRVYYFLPCATHPQGYSMQMVFRDYWLLYAPFKNTDSTEYNLRFLVYSDNSVSLNMYGSIYYELPFPFVNH